MATSNYPPGIRHEDSFSSAGPIAGETAPIAGFLCKTTWGPLNTPTLVSSFSEFLRKFGPYRSDSDAAYAVKGFFDNGGQSCYISRQAHYSSVTVPTTSAAAATKDVSDSAPDVVFAVDAKYPGDYGNDISFALTRNAKSTTTLSANVLAAATSFTVASPAGMYAGQILSLTDGVTTDYAKVVSVVSTVVGGVAVHTVTVSSGLTNGYSSTDDVVSLEFDLDVYYEDVLVESFEQVNLESETENYIETVVNDEDSGSLYVSIDVDAANTRLAAGYATVPTATYYPVTAVATALTGGVAVGTIDATDLAGDATGGVGVHSFDEIPDVRIIAAIPESGNAEYSAGFLFEAIAVAEARTHLFVLGSCLHTQGATAAIASRVSNGFNSPRLALSFNRIQVRDPLGTTRYVSPLGHWAGRIVAVDTALRSGPWNAAAGVAPRGNLTGAIGVEAKIGDDTLKNLNNAGITVIRNMPNLNAVLVWGARTQVQGDDQFLYINTIRSLMYMKQSISDGLSWAVFRNNDTELATEVKDSVKDFLNGIWKQGGLKGDTVEDAYVVLAGETDGVQTPVDTAAGRFVCEIGVALQRPAEFVVFRWSEEVGR